MCHVDSARTTKNMGDVIKAMLVPFRNSEQKPIVVFIHQVVVFDLSFCPHCGSLQLVDS